jgi:hypothetical protein
MEGKESYILYVNYHEQIKLLSDAQAGILFKTIDLYVNDLNPPDPIDPLINIVWTRIKKDLKTDLKRWKDQCSKNRENILKRWNKSNTNVFENEQPNTSVYEEVQDLQANTNFTDKEHEHDSEHDSEHDNNDLTDYNEIISKDFAHAHEEEQKIFENDFWRIVEVLEQYYYISKEESLNRANIEAYEQCINKLLAQYSIENVITMIRHFGHNYESNFAIDTDVDPIKNKPAYLYSSILELAKKMGVRRKPYDSIKSR